METSNIVAVRMTMILGKILGEDLVIARESGIDFRSWWFGIHRALIAIVAAHIVFGTKGNRENALSILKNTMENLSQNVENGLNSIEAQEEMKNPSKVVEDLLNDISKGG